MLFKITATTIDGKRLRTFTKARSFKNICSKADFINDAITLVIGNDFIDTLLIESWQGDYEDVFIKISGNSISGHVVLGNCKLVDLN